MAILFPLILVFFSSVSSLLPTPYSQICVDGSSLSFVDGIYKYLYFSQDVNDSIYYNSENKEYLYPFINGTGIREYHIHRNITNSETNARCRISNPSLSYTFINHCYIKNQFSLANFEWKYDPNMLVFNCDSLCINGNSHKWLNGEYFWTHFNRTTNSSVYHCSNCKWSMYLYLIIRIRSNKTYYQWFIGPDHTASWAYSWCDVGTNLPSTHIFNIHDCTEWHTTTTYNGSIQKDPYLTIQRCPFNVTTQPTTEIDEDAHTKNAEHFGTTLLIIVIVFSSICFILFIAFIMKFCIDTEPEQIALESPTSPRMIYPINNPLVLIIPIGDYQTDQKRTESDINLDLEDFPVYKDVKHITELFDDKLNYRVLLKKEKDTTYYWTETALISFLKDAGKQLFDDHNELQHDGLIVCISCHGIENHIITSDYKTVHKAAIHRIFSINYRKCREIPRIFLFDCCDGSESRINTNDTFTEKTESDINEYAKYPNDTEEYSKYFGVDNLGTNKMWTNTEPNPDYNLCEIHASNVGFTAKANIERGSYLLYEFIKKVKENLDQNKTEIIGRIFEEIQNELHEKGKQQTINVFNNDTRYLTLQKRDK